MRSRPIASPSQPVVRLSLRRGHPSPTYAARTFIRAAASLVFAIVLGGCDGESSLLAPDGIGELYELTPVDAPALVGVAGSSLPARIAVRVAVLPGRSDADPAPQLSFRVVTGAGRLLHQSARPDSTGIASVGYDPADGADSTVVRVSASGDSGAVLDVVVLARPALRLTGAPGAVLEVPSASAGVVLIVPPHETYDLVPFVSSAVRGRLEYAFVGGRALYVDLAALSAEAPSLEPAGASSPDGAAASSRLAASDRAAFDPEGASGVEIGGDAFAADVFGAAGDVEAGEVGDTAALQLPILAGSGVPSSLPADNCLFRVDRRATLAHVGSRVALYVDGLEPPDPAFVAELARSFDEVAPEITRLVGEPTDLDHNGRLLAVLSRAFPRGEGVYCHSVHRIGREVVYAFWDPAASVEDHLRVVAHEFQHVVNASHYFRDDPGEIRSDPPWLNEGLSRVVEWRLDLPAAALSEAAAFLNRVNGALPLLGDSRHPGAGGGWFLFVLYLGDRFGDELYRRLGDIHADGRAKVERATGISFRDLLRDWFVTLALSDALARPEWSYRSIRLAGEEERVRRCACFPAGRLPGTAFDRIPAGRDVRIARTLEVQDADFLRFTAGEEPEALFFSAGGHRDLELVAIRRD